VCYKVSNPAYTLLISLISSDKSCHPADQVHSNLLSFAEVLENDDALHEKQRSIFEILNISTDVWSAIRLELFTVSIVVPIEIYALSSI